MLGLGTLRRVARELRLDVAAVHERDPAARGVNSVEILLHWPGVQNLYDDWANVTYYSLFFLLGFALCNTVLVGGTALVTSDGRIAVGAVPAQVLTEAMGNAK